MKVINQKHGVDIGDLAMYMGWRTILVVDIDEEWVYGIELGERHIAKYKPSALKAIV